MEVDGRVCDPMSEEETMMMDLRRGPWTAEEDLTLVNYIDKHGEGRWNSLARCAGETHRNKISIFHTIIYAYAHFHLQNFNYFCGYGLWVG